MIRAAERFKVLVAIEPTPQSIPPATYHAILYFAAQSFQASGQLELALETYRRVLAHPIAKAAPSTELVALSHCHAGQCSEALFHFEAAESYYEAGARVCREAKSEKLGDAERWLAGARRTLALRDQITGPSTPNDSSSQDAAAYPTPTTSSDAFSLARLAAADRRPVESAGFYERGLSLLATEFENVELPLPRWHRVVRYAAAVAALEASQSSLLTFQQKSEWRERARLHLRANLDAWQEDGDDTTTPVRERRFRLEYWLADEVWHEVRDPIELSRRTREERVAWSRLWSDHASLLP